jgi:hypothetical protein
MNRNAMKSQMEAERPRQTTDGKIGRSAPEDFAGRVSFHGELRLGQKLNHE